MKTKTIFSVGAAMVASATFSLVAEEATHDSFDRDAAQPHFLQRIQPTANPAKASQLISREVTDANGHKIGKVRDLAIDMQNGRVVEVILGTSKFLGMKERETALPPGQFCWDGDNKKLSCVLDQDQLRNAPVFDINHWKENVRPENVRAIYHRYDVAPWFIDDSLPAPAATEVKPATQLTSAGLAVPTVHLGSVQRLRDIMGATVQDQGQERLGKVENVIVDLASSRVIVLLVSTGGFLGIGNEESAIPPQAFRYDEERNKLSLNITPDALRAAPHYKPDQWPSVASSDQIATVYNAYKVPPYPVVVDADNTAQNVRDRSDNTVTPIDQGRNAHDRAITARIRQNLMARTDLSTYAHNVKIITADGQVTLRGPVKSAEEKAKVVEIAKNAVPADTRVTDQIQTISEPGNVKADPAAYNSTNSN